MATLNIIEENISSETSSCFENDIQTSNTQPSSKDSTENLKKTKKKPITICLTNCRYDVIRKTAAKYGYKEVCETENWNMFWTDLSISIERCKEMKRYQKINHFPGMLEISRKDLLARNLNKMLRLFPKDYNFFPRTWCFPADFGDALSYSRLRRNRTFIIKPEAGSQGRGIYITKNLQELRPTDRCVCQVYISKPYLLDGYKFDLRLYTLITSTDPLRIYVYDEGLVRFATSKYKDPIGSNLNNVFMHLTNYAVNKYSRTYNQNSEYGSKRKITWFFQYLKNLGHNTDDMWGKINDIIIKTVISAHPVLKHSYAACFPNHDLMPACCELLGIDVLLDKKLNPHLLEVNHSPSFHTDTAIDHEIKNALISDMFAMLNLEHCDKRKVIREDRKRVRDRLLKGINNGSRESNYTGPNESRCFTAYYRREIEKSGGFTLIYPVKYTMSFYSKFFDHGQNSIYSETIASHAREIAQNALRDEMLLKTRLEAAKRVPPQPKKIFAPKIESITKFSTGTLVVVDKNSFEPQLILENEEKDRLQRLAQREYLIRSKGILEHVYFFMKKNGNLRPREQRKFAIFEKLRKPMGVNVDGPAISDLLDTIK